MREIQVSDDPAVVWLSPERCRAARALLGWSPDDLARQVMLQAGMLGSGANVQAFEDQAVTLSEPYMDAVLAVLLKVVEFTAEGDQDGVVLKRHRLRGRGAAHRAARLWAGLPL